jgi:5-methyltetrahydrofolate--homocysteine methyltransferase
MSKLTDRLAEVQPYWNAYWRGEVPMVVATVPKPDRERILPPAWGDLRYHSVEEIGQQLLGWARSHDFAGGAVPAYVVSICTGFVAQLVGAELEICGDSAKVIPCIEDLDTAEIRFDPDGPMWRRFLGYAEQLQEICGDEVMICAPCLGGNLDLLDGLRGTTELLFDLIDNPEGVHRCLRQMDAIYGDLIERADEVFQVKERGTVNRHGMYCRGRTAIPQCDFSCMIGPDMFREFAIPYLQGEMRRLDGVEYHLDGPDAICHLEAVCELPEVNLIQWVPGAGNERRDWTALFDRIDELGKGQLRGGALAGFEAARARYSSPWLYWMLGGTPAAEVNAIAREIMG